MNLAQTRVANNVVFKSAPVETGKLCSLEEMHENECVIFIRPTFLSAY